MGKRLDFLRCPSHLFHLFWSPCGAEFLPRSTAFGQHLPFRLLSIQLKAVCRQLKNVYDYTIIRACKIEVYAKIYKCLQIKSLSWGSNLKMHMFMY